MNDVNPLSRLNDLGDLNTQLDPLSYRAGWNKAEPSLWAAPRTRYVPMQWHWRDAKAGLDTAGRLIDTELAERRNLLMVNPIAGNHYPSLRTLVSAYQMILPGEKARSHRHSPHALRFVLDVGEGAYTVVDGVRIDMQPGDVLLTPGWCWHGHGNDGDQPGYWVDFLDVPTVQLLEPMFFETFPDEYQAPTLTTRDHPFVFPWEETDRALCAAQGGVSERHGVRIRLDQDGALPSMALHMQRLPAGFSGRRWRSSANRLVCVKSGSGSAQVGDCRIDWLPGDVFTVPAWHAFQLDAREASDLFTVSDEGLQEKLRYLREEDI
ncbi:MAG: cupin domain-containing protein [Pigmentiphaga sp.]